MVRVISKDFNIPYSTTAFYITATTHREEIPKQPTDATDEIQYNTVYSFVLIANTGGSELRLFESFDRAHAEQILSSLKALVDRLEQMALAQIASKPKIFKNSPFAPTLYLQWVEVLNHTSTLATPQNSPTLQ
jgi:hypothetical protein